MLAIVGTVPDPDLPVIAGPAALSGEGITVAGHRLAIQRGTPALIAAALAVSSFLQQPPPMAYLAGDIGLGNGSRRLYGYLCDHLAESSCTTLVFHYLQPDVDWHNRVLFAVQAMAQPPCLIADAGFMYAAKMSGQAEAYDLFTPDIGELSFLADEKAPHPFYTRGFILHMDDMLVPEMIVRAYRHGNAARHLLVKGRRDYIADRQGIHSEIDTPSVPFLEPIGGTGDTISGIAAVLIDVGRSIVTAAENAAKINRIAGQLAQPTPATQVADIIAYLPQAVCQVIGNTRHR